ncbi:hypothetical protein [Persicitalea jodogahamensis]|uniref:Uncharacterized protein n=1 Tax=Persicitalea jodogahamensis TaxID=402147 RepID=A0A8J3GBB5_9BACT|nr:hypothetical protein [Persicitalea jodogahamensis]GHB86103.1 hypothetical protein GCM10007390_46930 [Persicitalea jodogahamensis]
MIKASFMMLLQIISNGGYILFSFVAFIVYAFIYLSSVGLLNGRKEDMQNRPVIAGYESLRNGDRNIGEADKAAIESLIHPSKSGDGDESSYDYEATFYGSQSNKAYVVSSLEALREDEADEEIETPSASPSIDDDEDEDEWPALGRAIEYGTENSDHELTLSSDIIGDLTAEELVLLTNIRATTLNDAEQYPELVEECMVANDRVNELVLQTGKSVDEIVSTLLNTREKVIFNAFPMREHNRAA